MRREILQLSIWLENQILGSSSLSLPRNTDIHTTPQVANLEQILSSSRAWYGASIKEFLGPLPATIFGVLAQNPEFDLATTQKQAWLQQISFLQTHLVGLSGSAISFRWRF